MKFKRLAKMKHINSKDKFDNYCGTSYAAKTGETDDLVMASLLIVRILTVLSDYHYNLESHIRDHEEYIAPLPFFAVIN